MVGAAVATASAPGDGSPSSLPSSTKLKRLRGALVAGVARRPAVAPARASRGSALAGVAGGSGSAAAAAREARCASAFHSSALAASTLKAEISSSSRSAIEVLASSASLAEVSASLAKPVKSESIDQPTHADQLTHVSPRPASRARTRRKTVNKTYQVRKLELHTYLHTIEFIFIL